MTRTGKRRIESLKLSAEIDAIVRDRRFCEASTPDCDSFSDELHEPIETGTRIPARDHIVRLAGCIAVCRHCHNYIHRNRDYAIARGLIFPH